MESVVLKVTSAFLAGGSIARTGELVEVSMAEAKDLLARGKATLAENAPAVAIHFSDEVHAPLAAEALEPEAEEPASEVEEPAEEAPAEKSAKAKSKKAK